jgi:hypothetical protein
MNERAMKGLERGMEDERESEGAGETEGWKMSEIAKGPERWGEGRRDGDGGMEDG